MSFLLVAGIATILTFSILDYRLEQWVKNHPRPRNALCSNAEPVEMSVMIQGDTDASSRFGRRCYPTSVGRSINVWHTFSGSGSNIRVYYDILDTPSTYPAALGGSKKTAKPNRISVFTGGCSDAGASLTSVASELNNVTFTSNENERYYFYVIGYGEDDVYSTQEFCINVEYDV